MRSRARHGLKFWSAGLIVVGLIAATAVAGLATGTKTFKFTVSPTSVGAGTTQTFQVRVTNTTPGNSNIDSFSVSVPSQFAVTGATLGTSSNANASASVSPSGQTVNVQFLDPVKSNQYATVNITTSVTSTGLSCGSSNSSNPWSVTPWTGSNLSGTTFADTSSGTDLASHTTSISDKCLSFTVQPSNGVVNTAISPAVQVTLSDGASGVTVAMSKASGPGTLSGTLTATTNGSGVASFSNLKLDAAGTYTLSASATGYATATSNSFVIRSLGFTVQPSDVVVNTAISPSVEVTLSDHVNGVTVTISKASGPGTLSGTLTATTTTKNSVDGVATFSDLKLNTVSDPSTPITLQAAATGYGTATSNSFQVYGASLSGQNCTATAPTNGDTSVTVQMQPDGNGNCQLLYTLTASTHEVDFFKNATANSKFQMTISWGTPYSGSQYPDTEATTFDVDGVPNNGDEFTPDYCAIANNLAQYPINPWPNPANPVYFWPDHKDQTGQNGPQQPWCTAHSTVAPHHFLAPSPGGTDAMQLTEIFLGSGDPIAHH